MGGELIKWYQIQVIIQAKDQLSSKVDEINNKLKSTGTSASTAMNQTKNATSQASNALNQQSTTVSQVQSKYQQLRGTVTQAFNGIKQAIMNSSPAKYITSSSIAEPFKNAAETIKGKWQSMMQYIRSTKAKPNIDTSSITPAEAKVERLVGTINRINATRASPRFDLTTMQSADGKIKVILKDLESLRGYKVNLNVGSSGSELNNLINMVDKVQQRANKLNNTTVTPKISPAGLATLNGEVSRTGQIVQQLQGRFGALGSMLASAFMKGNNAVVSFKGKLSGIKDKLTNLASGLSGVQGLLMSAFATVGVTSIKSFTIEAAIAREKVNAVTQAVAGSQSSFVAAQKSIKNAIAGTTLGYNNMATAVNNVALRFHVTGDALQSLPGPMAKVGIMAQAMGKSSEEAASIMEHAFDGLQGKWRSLKQIGITEEDLKAAGWSGAANDIQGYAAALDKVLETGLSPEPSLVTFNK